MPVSPSKSRKNALTRAALSLVTLLSLSCPPLPASPDQGAGGDWRIVDALHAYDGDDLGCRYENGVATLKLWAPRATRVTVFLYDGADQTRLGGRRELMRQPRGVWAVRLTPDDVPGLDSLRGCFYQYEVKNPGRPARRVLDPYARSMAAGTVDTTGRNAGSSGDFVGKAAIVNPSGIGVDPGKSHINGYTKREDAVIWEMHVRDFTSDPNLQNSLSARWGGYRAFIEKLTYIKSLGVTHIQLLPVQAWYFGDESRTGTRELHWSTAGNEYNWGYDPHNYFTPDGAYSEKPSDPESRIAELKQLIRAIHEAGMGVILDVVYTHMAKAEFLDDIVPGYYFFRDPSGKPLGDFGNNLATNRRMAEKLVVDSVQHWFREYGIDGMRWDMMGDATAEAVRHAFDAARRIHPQALFLGEGWRTFKGHIEDPALQGKAADQDWMDDTDSVGVFSDEFRNELKSGFGCEGQPMFLTGGPREIRRIFANIKAQPGNTPADDPGDMVQYIAAHDNLPLYDVIAQSIRKDPDLLVNDREIHRRIRLGHTLLLTAQGTVFLHGGQEYGRTNQWRAPGKPEQKFHELAGADGKPFRFPFFIHDSYDSSDAINRFDWAKAEDIDRFPENAKTRAYTAGLIALRRSTDAFRLGSRELVDRNVRLLPVPEIGEKDLVIAYRCRATTGEAFDVFVNADSRTRRLSLDFDPTAGQIVARSGTAQLSRSRIILAPLSCLIIRHPRGSR